ncbi:uncharacterized protein [Musca autumnalis]|uniref:uncharacterized protein n=1 Tax=Musca autumnalis TaxID=221902 RepID=UPI003CEE7B6D
MLKILSIALLCVTAIFVQDVPWYPKNYKEIEAKCREQYPIGADMLVNENGKFRVKQHPILRSYFFCTGLNKNLYNPDLGFIGERISYDIQKTFKYKCPLDLIQDCIDNSYEDSYQEDVIYFNIMKCILENAFYECERV